jgi:hypothetical protein
VKTLRKGLGKAGLNDMARVNNLVHSDPKTQSRAKNTTVSNLQVVFEIYYE